MNWDWGNALLWVGWWELFLFWGLLLKLLAKRITATSNTHQSDYIFLTLYCLPSPLVKWLYNREKAKLYNDYLERTCNFIMFSVESDFLHKLRYMRNVMCENCWVREAKCRAYCSMCSSSVNYLCLKSKYLECVFRVHAWLQLYISTFLRCFCHYLK